MRDTKGSIIVKLCTLVAFVVFIVGGGYMMYYYFDEEWLLFALGCCLLAVGFFLMGVLCPLILRYEQNGSLRGTTVKDCIKAGIMLMFFCSCIVFFGLGVILWITCGLWQIGIASIGVLAVAIFIAFEVSIDYQTNGASKRVKRDPDAVEHTGTVTSIHPRYPIILFKTVYMFYEYVIEIDGVKSTAFLKRGNKLRSDLLEGSSVTVKFNPQRPKNCLIIEVLR